MGLGGAGYGNRTRLTGLGSQDITTMLSPPTATSDYPVDRKASQLDACDGAVHRVSSQVALAVRTSCYHRRRVILPRGCSHELQGFVPVFADMGRFAEHTSGRERSGSCLWSGLLAGTGSP